MSFSLTTINMNLHKSMLQNGSSSLRLNVALGLYGGDLTVNIFSETGHLLSAQLFRSHMMTAVVIQSLCHAEGARLHTFAPCMIIQREGYCLDCTNKSDDLCQQRSAMCPERFAYNHPFSIGLTFALDQTRRLIISVFYFITTGQLISSNKVCVFPYSLSYLHACYLIHNTGARPVCCLQSVYQAASFTTKIYNLY